MLIYIPPWPAWKKSRTEISIAKELLGTFGAIWSPRGCGMLGFRGCRRIRSSSFGIGVGEVEGAILINFRST